MHTLLAFAQCLQIGNVCVHLTVSSQQTTNESETRTSSHFSFRVRHVLHPVLVRLIGVDDDLVDLVFAIFDL